MITRDDYIKNRATHRQYYNEYVMPRIRELVLERFSAERLQEALAEDEHLNSIALSKWDGVAQNITGDHQLHAMLKERGDFMTQAAAVCILKEAARQVVEQTQPA